MQAFFVTLAVCLSHQVLANWPPWEHRGYCPRFPRLPCPYEYKNECRRDSDCREDQKCCWTRCGQGCLTPLGVSSELSFCNLPSGEGCDNDPETRWFYNPGVKRCEDFLFHGCPINANNFRSREECEARCDKSTPRCLQPRPDSICDGNFRRYWYNVRTRRCEPFGYGGCLGNDNNFETRWQCHRECIGYDED